MRALITLRRWCTELRAWCAGRIWASRAPGLWAHLRDARLLLLVLLFALPGMLIPLARAESSELLWQRVENWQGEHEIQRILVAPGASSPIYALGATGGLYISHDGAHSWAQARIPFPAGLFTPVRVLDLAIHPQNPAEAYVVVAPDENRPRPVVYVTRDGGTSWSAESGLGPLRVRAIAYGPDGRDLYLAVPGEIYRFDHSGAGALDPTTLTAPSDRWRIASLETGDGVTAIVVGAWEGTSALGQGRRFVYLALKSGGMYVLLDDPAPQATALPMAQSDVASALVRQQAQVAVICPHNARATTVCAATDRGMYASIDGGGAWFPTAYALRHRQVRALHIDPADGLIYAGVSGDGVHVSRDDGATWERLGRGLGRATVLSLAISQGESGRTLYAATGDGLWRIALP